MSSCNDKNNKPEEEQPSESFLYRRRWWVVLVLALLLGYYLYTKRASTGESSTGVTAPVTSTGTGLLGPGELVLASPPSTDKLFKF